MNVLVLHSQVPFASGGAEVLVNGLVAALRDRGHIADLVSIPYQWNPPERLLDTALAWRLLDLRSFNGVGVDRVICTKFPTWAVDHPRKSLWLIHQHRQAYDLFGTPHSEFGTDDQARQLRRAVFEIDGRGIGECDRKYAISRNVASRLQKYNGIRTESLYPPIPHDGLYAEAYEPFILSAARLDALKRVESLIEALPHIDTSLSIKVTSDGPMRLHLEQLAQRLEVEDRVEFLGRVSDTNLVDLYNRCRAVYYAPIDEDYGYSAVEALAAGKPVITSDDSGGVLEFVGSGTTGMVTSLAPEALGRAASRLADESFARELGENGHLRVDDLSWDTVVQALVGS